MTSKLALFAGGYSESALRDLFSIGTAVDFNSVSNDETAVGVEAGGGVIYETYSGYLGEKYWSRTTATSSTAFKKVVDVADQTVAISDRDIVSKFSSTSANRMVSGHGSAAGDTYVVGEGGQIAKLSSNGGVHKWKHMTVGTNASNFSAIASNGTITVIVGYEGTILTSTDPSSGVWTPRDSKISTHLYSVIYDGTRFIACGSDTTILFSTDGITWSFPPGVLQITTMIPLAAVASSGSTIVAVSQNANQIVRSADSGATWSIVSITGSVTLSDIIWSSQKSLFVTVGQNGVGGTILTSPDGITWTARTSNTDEGLQSIAFGNGVFVAVGGYSNCIVVTSSDGITWTKRVDTLGEVPTSVEWVQSLGLFIAGFYGGIKTSPTGVTWTTRISGFGELVRTRGIVFTDNKVFSLSEQGTLRSSSDGIVWDPNLPIMTRNSYLRGSTEFNGNVVVVGDHGNIFTSSDAGNTWVPRLSKTADHINSVASNGSFVLTAVTGKGKIIRSLNSIDWDVTVAQSDSEGFRFNKVIWANNKFLAVGKSGVNYSFIPAIFESVDGINWTRNTSVPVPSGESLEIVDIAVDGTGRVVIALQNTPLIGSPNSYILVSTTNAGTSWVKPASAPTGNYAVSVTAYNNTMIATYTASIVGSPGLLISTDNGENWNQPESNYLSVMATPNAPGGLPSFTRSIFNNGSHVYALGPAGIGRASVASPTTWAFTSNSLWPGAKYTVPVSTSLADVSGAKLPNGDFRLVAVGTNGTIVSNVNNSGWSVRSSGTADNFTGCASVGTMSIAVTSSGKIFSSADTISWTQRASTASGTFSGVTWISEVGQFIAYGNNALYTSADGITWTVFDIQSSTISKVKWLKGCVFAVGSPSTWWSLNGVTWSRKLNDFFSPKDSALAGNTIIAINNGFSFATASIPSATWSGWATTTTLAPPVVFKSVETSIQSGKSTAVAVLTHGTTRRMSIADVNNDGVFSTVSTSTYAGRDIQDFQPTTTLLGVTPGLPVNNTIVVGNLGVKGVIYVYNNTAESTRTVTKPTITTIATRLNATAWSGSLHVAVGDNGTALISSNGTAWGETSTGTTNSLNAVTYGDSKFVAVGDNGHIIFGNGTSWTPAVSGTWEHFYGVTWTGSRFIAVGANGIVKVSVNGIDWGAGLAFNGTFTCIDSKNGETYAAYNDGSTTRILKTDAIGALGTWTIDLVYQGAINAIAVDGSGGAQKVIAVGQTNDAGFSRGLILQKTARGWTRVNTANAKNSFANPPIMRAVAASLLDRTCAFGDRGVELTTIYGSTTYWNGGHTQKDTSIFWF